MKVMYTNKAGCSILLNIDRLAQIYPHFKLYELANNKGKAALPQYIITPDSDDFMLLVEEFRSWWGRPMTCSSCYRQEEFNRQIGGAANSLHLSALAFDWLQQLTYAQRCSVAQVWRQITTRAGRIGGINFYPWGAHLDSNEDRFGYRSFVIRDGDKVVPAVPRP